MRYQFHEGIELFGFYQTASFFHLDSIALGVILAYQVYVNKMQWQPKRFYFYLIFAVTIVAFYLITKFSNQLTWSVGQSFANILIGVLILTAYYTKPVLLAKSFFIKKIALMAYSIYLVHPLLTHASLIINAKMGISSLILQYSIVLLLVYVVAQLFYFIVEKQSLSIRDRLLKK